jgi:hypothetical protein
MSGKRDDAGPPEPTEATDNRTDLAVARFEANKELVQVRVLSLLRTRDCSYKKISVTGGHGASWCTASIQDG